MAKRYPELDLGSQPTYKELKPLGLSSAYENRRAGSQPTYKELKPAICAHESGWGTVPSLPIRN